MVIFTQWMTLLAILSSTIAQITETNNNTTQVISTEATGTLPGNETTGILLKEGSNTTETVSTPGSLPDRGGPFVNETTPGSGNTAVEDSIPTGVSSLPGTTAKEQGVSFNVTRSQSGTTPGLLTNEGSSTNEFSSRNQTENYPTSNTINENTISKIKSIMSLWKEVMNLAGNDSRTQEWTATATVLWNEMMTREWSDLSVARWNSNMTSLWDEIMTSLEDEDLDPAWNKTMVVLWNDFIGSYMGGLTTYSSFPETEMAPPYIVGYPNIPTDNVWGWHPFPDHGWETYPEWITNNNTNYPESNKPEWGNNSNFTGILPDETKEVVLKQGTILGQRENTGGTYFYSFKGIPYAEPPVGNLRFKDPIPASSWNGTRNGTTDPPKCPQLQFYIKVGEEDCLYLNVYTPMTSKASLPVMVWIHGGSFVTGGADEYPPMPLMTQNIILVVIQYRLGTLGFLSTEDSVLPGNLGLKDQTLALQWVRDNIGNLGGDPHKVTIFGQSAGAASVHLQVISPKARGLFNRAIMQSGSALGQSVIRTDHKQVAMTVGQQYNCSAGEGEAFNSSTLLECLQALSLYDIVAVPTLFTMIVLLPTVMTPRVDGDFLPDHPASLLRQGLYNKVDIITGINEHEGALVALPFLLNPWLVHQLMGNFDLAGPTLVSLEKENEPVQLAHQILRFYLHEEPISLAQRDNFVQMISDMSYTFDHDEVVKIHSNDANLGFRTYSYEFQYRGQFSYADNYGPDAGKHWVTNGDELPYLFNNKLTILRRMDDLNMRDYMVKLWTNFALTGKPTPDFTYNVKWLPATPTCFQYLAIDRFSYMKSYDRIRHMEFWKSLSLQTNQILNPPHKWQSFIPIQSPVQNCWAQEILGG